MRTNNLFQNVKALVFLIGLFILGNIVFGCSGSVRLSDDPERFRSLSVLIKRYNEEIMKAGMVNDTVKMKQLYETLQGLEMNRLFLLKVVLEENKIKIADEIMMDDIQKTVRWVDTLKWKQGDCFYHDKYHIGIIISKRYINDGGECFVFADFGNSKLGVVNIKDIEAVDCRDVQESLKQHAKVLIDRINKPIVIETQKAKPPKLDNPNLKKNEVVK